MYLITITSQANRPNHLISATGGADGSGRAFHTRSFPLAGASCVDDGSKAFPGPKKPRNMASKRRVLWGLWTENRQKGLVSMTQLKSKHGHANWPWSVVNSILSLWEVFSEKASSNPTTHPSSPEASGAATLGWQVPQALNWSWAYHTRTSPKEYRPLAGSSMGMILGWATAFYGSYGSNPCQK